MTREAGSSGELREEAIVVGAVDYGESDRIVTLFCKGQGKVGAFVKGARASKKRFGGALESFTHLDVRLTRRRGSLYLLTSCTIRDAFLGLRGSLEGIAYAGHAAELCRELCRDHEPHEALYDLLVAYLASLSRGEVAAAALLAFELLAVGEAGFAPRLDACARCGRRIEEPRILFDPGHGGILCPACAGPRPQEGFFVSPSALAWALLQQQGSGAAPVDERSFADARRLVRSHTRHVLGKAPRSLEVIRQLGLE